MPYAAFETMRVMHGAAPFLERHLERLYRDALAVGVAGPGPGVREAVAHAVRGLGDGVLRVEWDGLAVQLATHDVEAWGDVRLSLAAERHRGYGYKSTDRAWLDRELASARRGGVDETLFLTDDGLVAEGAVSAVGFVMREVVVFPPLELAILPSIGRQRVIELARELGLGVRERRTTVEDLRGHPAFVVNAVRGVGRVVSLEGEGLPNAGLVGMLARAFWPSG